MMRGGVITRLLTTDKATLQDVFDTGGSSTTSDLFELNAPYAAGYMLLRYLAKQGQGQSISKEVEVYNESFSPTPPKGAETGVAIDFSNSTTADGSALTVPDSFDGQGFCILCGGCEQYINITFDKNIDMKNSTLKSTMLTSTYRQDYTIGIKDVTSIDDLPKAIFEGIKNASGRSKSYDVSVVKDGTSDIVCVGIDYNHNVRIAKNPEYPSSSNSEYIFLKNSTPKLLFMDTGTIEARGVVGSKDDAPAGTANEMLDKYGNEIFDENGDPIPHVQTIKVDTDTPVKIWEPKYDIVTRSEGNPLVIHSGTQANQHTNYFINDMQTKSLTAGKIFDTDSDAQKTERTLIRESDRELKPIKTRREFWICLSEIHRST